MKKFTKPEVEFKKMQKMYDNCTGVHDHQDLQTFAWNYYNDQIKKLEDLREFWTAENLQKFLAKKEEAESKKEVQKLQSTGKKVVIKVKAKK